MATYFTERRERDQISVVLDGGKTTMTCRIFEHWEDTDNTTTARCGDPGVIEVRKVVGISERDEAVLKTQIQSMIGVKGFAELKSSIESSIKKEVNFSLEESTVKTSNFSSPDCGRKTMFVYQLIREYQFFFSKRFLGYTRTWERKVTERTNVHDFLPDIEEFDELCNCREPPHPTPFDGTLVIDMGSVSVRGPYRRIQNGIEVRVDNALLRIAISDSKDFLVDIPVAALPEMVRLLGEFETETVQAKFYEYQAPQLAPEQSRVIGEDFKMLELDAPSVEVVQDLTKFHEGDI